MFVSCGCRLLSVRVLCLGLIIRPENSYRLWYVVVCDLKTSREVTDYSGSQHQRGKGIADVGRDLIEMSDFCDGIFGFC